MVQSACLAIMKTGVQDPVLMYKQSGHLVNTCKANSDGHRDRRIWGDR